MARKGIYPESVTPGIPKLGKKPTGWREVYFKDVLKVVERKAVLQDDKNYMLVNAKRNRGGIVSRAVLPGKKILTKTQFFIKEGDFLIANRQIVHGACGVVPKGLDGSVVSNEYTVLRPQNGLELNYLTYLTHTVYFQQTCFQSSVGVDVEKMIFKLREWLKYKIYLPSFIEQQKVVKILSIWENAIDLTEKLIQSKTKFKKGLMKQLLVEQKCVKGNKKSTWVKHDFSDIFYKVAIKKFQIKKDQYREHGKYPIVDQGKNLIVAFSDSQNVFCDVPVIIFGDHTKIVKWIDFPFVVGADGTHALKTKQICDIKFGLYLLENTKLPDLGYSRHFKELKEKRFFLPKEIKAQQKISSVLSSCDKEMEILQMKLDALKQQKKGLIQILLKSKIRVKV